MFSKSSPKLVSFFELDFTIWLLQPSHVPPWNQWVLLLCLASQTRVPQHCVRASAGRAGRRGDTPKLFPGSGAGEGVAAMALRRSQHRRSCAGDCLQCHKWGPKPSFANWYVLNWRISYNLTVLVIILNKFSILFFKMPVSSAVRQFMRQDFWWISGRSWLGFKQALKFAQHSIQLPLKPLLSITSSLDCCVGTCSLYHICIKLDRVATFSGEESCSLFASEFFPFILVKCSAWKRISQTCTH